MCMYGIGLINLFRYLMYYLFFSWKTEVITIPMYFHIIYDGENGRKYTCGINGGNCDYIQNSVMVLNEGFRGKTTTMFEQNEHGAYLDTKIQFCLGERNQLRLRTMLVCSVCET